MSGKVEGVSDPAARLLSLLSLLQRRPRWTGPALAAELGVTTRTVRRDVERLRSLGYPVDAEPGPDGGYRLGVGGELPPLLLDDDEAVAVVVALELSVAGATAGLAQEALSALAKIERMLPAVARRRLRSVRAATEVLSGPGDATAGRIGPLLATLAQTVDGTERVVCDYVDRDGRASTRRLEPHRLVATNRRWYLLAYDLDRDDWRVLRVDRVADVRLTGHRFRPRPHDAAAMVSEAISTSPYRHQAVVRFDVVAEVLAWRVPPTVGTIEDDDGMGALLRVGSDDLAALAGHLVALDLPFEVLEPPELRAHLRRLGRQLSRRHVPRRGVGHQ